MPLLADNPTLPDAAARWWDLVVVGAGPAGSLAARQAALAGASVLLIDKASFPRRKVCGCCLNAAALEVLESVGLGDLPRRLGARPLKKIRLAAGGRFAECSLPGGASVSREALDAALIEAAMAAGAGFLPQTEAALRAKPQAREIRGEKRPCLSPEIETDFNYRVVQLRQGDRHAAVRARVVLAADGLAGRLLHDEAEIAQRVADGSRLGAGAVLDEAPAFFADGVIYMASGRGGYVGLVRLEDGRLDAAAALDRGAVRQQGGPGPLAAAILREAGLPVLVGFESAAWRGTPPLTRRPAQLSGQRLLVVGDAAGYIEPFTGEGMAWALAGAAAVAPLAIAGVEDWNEEIGAAWEESHRQLIGRRQHVCRWVSRLLRRPRWCAAAVTLLGFAPQLIQPIVKAINRPFALDNHRLTAPQRGAQKAVGELHAPSAG